jgi:hypothetical protein
MTKVFIISTVVSVFLFAYQVDLKSKKLYNQTAYIPSQCYTKTVDEKNPSLKYNPCFSCHIDAKKPNYVQDDDDLQLAYDFPSSALQNKWTNLFKDRSEDVAKISDEYMMKYIKESNYIKDGKIILSQKLKKVPIKWDFNKNNRWDGYIPDCYFNFDSHGFDKNLDGEYTGWRAFAYYPFLGTFWPTNGSTDDVLIRLAKPFMHDENGNFDIEVYKINLLVVESLIKQKTIDTFDIDEKKYGVDLNQNGKFDIANQIVFKWKKPKYNTSSMKIYDFSMSYVGEAKKLLESNEYLIAVGLYPKDTEFLHSVRYIDIDKDGNTKLSARMKELRYSKKHFWYTYFQHENASLEQIKEQDSVPDSVDKYVGNIEVGVNNKLGWYYQGFIEDKKGDLRPQSYEETLFCIGCHSNIGAIADSTFVFQRKLEHDTFANGWYHWSQKGLRNIADMPLPNGQTEYVRYLQNNSAGDEFRQNSEVIDKFFIKDSKTGQMSIKQDEVKKLKKDISHLILPSEQRAMNLNKAYKVIVDEQSYIYGRDAHIKPVVNVHKNVKDGQSTHLEKVSD